MKLYSFLTTERTGKTQGAHEFIRYDLRVGSAADSQQIGDILLRAEKQDTGAIIFTLELDGVTLAKAVQLPGQRVTVKRIKDRSPFVIETLNELDRDEKGK